MSAFDPKRTFAIMALRRALELASAA